MPTTTSTDARLQIARPTISVGGSDNAALALGLTSLTIAENTSGLYRCEALFGNWGEKNQRLDFLFFDRRTLDFGKALQIKLGSTVVFEGRIMALEAHFGEGSPPELAVLAEDRLQDLRMTRRTRSFHDLSDSDLFRQIAGEHGLSATLDITGPTHKVLAQVNQSDLAFLRQRARTIDAEVWVEGSGLQAKQRSRRTSTPLQLTYGNQLRQFSVIADLARQHTSVTIAGWDVAAKSGLRYEATDSILNGELNGDQSGASILAASIGQRKESLVHTTPLTSQEAQVEAESYFRMNARRFIVGRGVAEPDSRLRVGATVDLVGLGALFSGKYYVCEAQILFDSAGGLRTEFAVERPGLGRA